MRIAPAILLLAAAGTCLSQDKNVTLQLGAGRIEKLLPEIAKAVGVQLLSTVQTKDEVLVIKVKDVPGSKLLEKIAETVNGTWQKEGDALRLIRTQSQLSAEAQEERTFPEGEGLSGWQVGMQGVLPRGCQCRVCNAGYADQHHVLLRVHTHFLQHAKRIKGRLISLMSNSI